MSANRPSTTKEINQKSGHDRGFAWVTVPGWRERRGNRQMEGIYTRKRDRGSHVNRWTYPKFMHKKGDSEPTPENRTPLNDKLDCTRLLNPQQSEFKAP